MDAKQVREIVRNELLQIVLPGLVQRAARADAPPVAHRATCACKGDPATCPCQTATCLAEWSGDRR